ncbi:MAG: hypothetical protein IJE43_02275 [Alphaproteobacteria bacterium]|nr:hypothetical protein [Alphaproteobacteria bacterium]
MLRAIKMGENIGVAIQAQGCVVDVQKHPLHKGLYTFEFRGSTWVCSDYAFNNGKQCICRKCGDLFALNGCDTRNKDLLCNNCYSTQLHGECDCEHCNNSYFEGDKLRCSLIKCVPVYND